MREKLSLEAIQQNNREAHTLAPLPINKIPLQAAMPAFPAYKGEGAVLDRLSTEEGTAL